MSPTQVSVVFIANKASLKFDEIENDAHVNVSFYDPSSTNWASYSGVAKVSQDKAKIEKHWSSVYVPVPVHRASVRVCVPRVVPFPVPTLVLTFASSCPPSSHMQHRRVVR